ncbi:hexose transporter [Gloeophyllum trabeum ATCC 11539]|uniref:Hexose transporter n=1 Tax=Gloeophyllum trabeum (strain ATCC 11539 / FP-39264 / Madison 617) TaxID=670483 RepID=S7RUL6_GLOTA|nr:hexose transporter [Gloeophyllum trabeum ATCC 11539]EPQ56894.1 hexose transporter [Gloeophyllum trabeum ATCC 11539]
MGTGPVIVADGNNFAGLIQCSRPWWKNRRLLTLNAWIALLLITSSTNGYDGSMMNGLQSLDQWNASFNNPQGQQLGLLNAIQNIGCLAAYPFSPYLTDGMGRRFSVGLGAALMLAATVIQTASQNVRMFIGARFLIGFGLTFAQAAAPLLISEIAYPSQRGQATSLYNSVWFLGSIIAAWTTFGTFNIPSSWAWRVPSALQGLPSLIQITLIWFAPESPRWLLSRGRETEALKTLAYYHADGNEQDPLVGREFEEIKGNILRDTEAKKSVGWSSLLKTPGNRRRTRVIVALAVFSQWSGNGLTSYYLSKVLTDIGVTGSTVQLLINGLLNIWNFVIAISAGLLCEKLGRRTLFMVSTIGMVVFWTLQTVCFAEYSIHLNLAAGHAVMAFIFLFYGFYDLAFTPLIVSYTVEILPFELRAKGLTLFFFTVSVSLIFNQYVNPIALKALGWKYYLVYVCWLAFEAIFVYAFVLETKNRTLEETSALFDGVQRTNMSEPNGLSEEVKEEMSSESAVEIIPQR